MTEPGDYDVEAERDWPLDQEACMAIIDAGETASGLLDEADTNYARRFRRLDTAIVKLLADVRGHFPDATYYTASGGFHLLLGHSHRGYGIPQSELVAIGGRAQISDGDF